MNFVKRNTAASEPLNDFETRAALTDQLGVSPQCGFATNLSGSPLTLQDQAAKLRLVVEIGNEVWKQ